MTDDAAVTQLERELEKECERLRARLDDPQEVQVVLDKLRDAINAAKTDYVRRIGQIERSHASDSMRALQLQKARDLLEAAFLIQKDVVMCYPATRSPTIH